jgi:flagellar L-ring protein precursor FlgH
MLKNFFSQLLPIRTMRKRAINQCMLFNAAKNLLCVHHFFMLICLILLLNGCAVTPTSVIQQPTSARAKEIEPPSASSGSIYTNRGFRAMFENRRPRDVGDIVTINIRENTNATKTNGSSASKDGSISTSVTSLFGRPLPRASIEAEGSNAYSDTANANSSNIFNGSITTTVTEVLANGFLVVSGEKQVSFDKGTEFVRFSGVVNPDTIAIGNTVNSTTVADARIEYRTSAKIDKAEIANMISRFFFSLGGL